MDEPFCGVLCTWMSLFVVCSLRDIVCRRKYRVSVAAICRPDIIYINSECTVIVILRLILNFG